MKFVISYSCGKDSALSLQRMLRAGHTPVALLTMYNQEVNRSWFHGVEEALLKDISDALEIPMILCRCTGEDYHLAMEEGLRKAKAMGAEACVFGDIDIEEHRTWGTKRAKQAGMKAMFPLWQENRVALVYEGIETGIVSIIKCIDNRRLPETLLGKVLQEDTLEIMRSCGIDLCGEEGEYHTQCVDGEIFHRPLSYKLYDIHRFHHISVIDIRRK